MRDFICTKDALILTLIKFLVPADVAGLAAEQGGIAPGVHPHAEKCAD